VVKSGFCGGSSDGMVIEVPEWVVEVDWRDIMLLAARPFLTRGWEPVS